LEKLLRENRDMLIDALYQDLGRSRYLSLTEIKVIEDSVEYMLAHIDRFVKKAT